MCVFFTSHRVHVPVAELSWHMNLLCVFIHGEVEVSAEPLQLYMVPVLVIQQTTQTNEQLTARG